MWCCASSMPLLLLLLLLSASPSSPSSIPSPTSLNRFHQHNLLHFQRSLLRHTYTHTLRSGPVLISNTPKGRRSLRNIEWYCGLFSIGPRDPVRWLATGPRILPRRRKVPVRYTRYAEDLREQVTKEVRELERHEGRALRRRRRNTR